MTSSNGPRATVLSWHANPAGEPHHFGSNHPMKPWRLTLTKQLVLCYGMHHAMDLYLSRSATYEEMAEFHSTDYLEFLTQVMPADMESTAQVETLARFNFGDDCPVFDGLYNYCSLYAASGFCYVNDIVLGILQLLRIHPRVMYIDIDVHHGDGVEQAFWSTDRVLTVSFHKYDKENFFPGTGPLDSTGPSHPLNPGAHHSLNVPLNDGIEDNDYIALFKAIIGPCIRTYQPGAIVLQCGADSLGCDRLGCFNLNIRAHGACVAYTKTFGLPTLVVGGGGYTPRNVSRLWAYETAICLEAESDLNPVLPDSLKFRNHFRPDCTLFPPLSEMRKVENKNSKAYLDSLVQSTMEQLRYIKGAPSVQMSVIPPDILGLREEIEKELEEEKLLGEEEKEDRDGAGVSTLGIGGSRPSRRKDQEKGLGVRGELYT
ncbi:histone deacetylase 1 [Coccidioides immitis RMSCC 3703]|uniref:Histone deacetylase n=1 Tax=Coccidioides immitis RMSCC 3703 TaxID=454286 RepID=A0A0J8R2S8_COCIT|nr:histone deacetylase 1 [Coccidioides immitis RMSCC 3703]